MSKFKLLGFLFACSLLLPSWAAAQIAPSITTQPAAQVVAPGANATFTVAATGSATLVYQWRKDGGIVSNSAGHIAGATGASLTITGATVDDVGSYTVDITNGSGSTTSDPAGLALLAPPVLDAVTNVTTSGFTVNWEPVSGATGYAIDVSLARTFTSFATGYQTLDVGSALTAAVTGLTDDTTYFYRIRPYNATGAGASSTWTLAAARTSAATPVISGGTVILHDALASVGSGININDNLSLDANGYCVPTATQAVWFEAGSGSGFTTVPGGSISLSAGSRGVLAYFQPSSSVVSLAVGETLSARVRFKYSDGSGAASPNPGDFRVGLLNSNGNGTNINVAGSTNTDNPARLTAQNFSLTGAGSKAARGYSGYVFDTTASPAAPAADTASFWQRATTTTPTTGGTTQWLGPTGTDILANTTFTQVGASGGGALGAIANDSRDYVLDLRVTHVSDTDVRLSCTVTTSGTVVQSYSVTQSAGTLDTSFDTFFLFSTFNGALHVLDLQVAKLPPPPTITTQPVSQSATIGASAAFTVAATSDEPASYQWQKRPSGGSFADIGGATSATLTLSNLQSDDGADYQVIVSNSGGSVTSDVATLTVGPAPDAPVAADGGSITSTAFTASWAAVSGATGYRLDVSTSPTFDTFVANYEDVDVGTDLSRVVTDLASDTLYYYRVRAVNVYGVGASSDPVPVTTLQDTGPVSSLTILNETFPLPTPDIIPPAVNPPPIANVNAGLAIDTNGFPTPTSTQAAYASFGTGNINYIHNTSLSLSASGSARGLIAYFEPSTSVASLAVGEALTAKVTFSLSGGTPVDRVGNLRFALLNSGGNGQATNLGTISARYAAGTSNSLTGTPTGNTARGYSGYIVNSEAAGSPTTDTLSFWQRTAALDSASGSTQLVGPTGGDLAATGTFAQIGAYGGGTIGTIANDATVYVATLSVKYVSATQVDLAYEVKTGDTVVMSYSVSQTSGTLVTSFDSLAFFSIYGPAPTISGLEISRELVAPAIATQPESRTVTIGEDVTLSVAAGGSAPLSYQWKKGGATLLDAPGHVSGATTSSLTLTNVQDADAADYTVVVSNLTGSVTSDPATLTVSAVVLPPTIATQPQAATAAYGGSASFTVAASGTPPYTYQWYKNDVAIDDATSATLSLSNVATADAASYKVTVTNSAGSATSAPVALTVTPAIVTQPKSQTAFTGGIVSFTVVARGAGPFTYQWRKGGTPIDGATGSMLTLTNLADTDAAAYSVVVSDAGGSITSATATLSVNTTVTVVQPTLPTIRSVVYNILDYYPSAAPLPAGALVPAADVPPDYTAAIQAAIDAAFAAGGGIVEIPASATPYLSGPLTLRSGINLQIDSGATLQALPYGTYPDGNTDFITVPNHSTDVAITGGGTIEGDGTAWWTAYNNDSSVARPRLVQFSGATRVLVSGLTLQNSPEFHLAFSGANDSVTITGVTISAPSTSPNTDGIDPSGSNFLIQNCAIAVGDDNIAVKAGSTPASKITVAYCAFGTGHGLSVGGQTNAGLDGLTVTNCTFNGTTSGLRLKADATQGGLVQNLAYSNLTMTNVAYPIVFYSYYNEIGTPGTTGGSAVTPATVNTRNAAALSGTAIPQWRKISISSLTATGASGYSIIWGLPLTEGLINDVTLSGVNISGGAGFKIYNATNVRFTGTVSAGTLTTANAAVITGQPQDVAPATPTTVNAGGTATFTVTAVATSGTNGTAPSYQWNHNGAALTEGLQPDGSTIAGTNTHQITITGLRGANAGAYTCTVSNHLDGYVTTADSFATDALPVSVTSSSASLTVNYSAGVDGDGNPLTPAPTIPTVTTALVDQGVAVGSTVHFTAAFASDYPITAYQWLKDGVLLADGGNLSGATTASLTIASAQVADAGVYTALAWDEAGAVSTAATLVVGSAPVITQQPAGPAAAVLEGVDVSFAVVATGYDPKTYQWMFNGIPLTDDGDHISGATTDTLQISGVVAADAGSYTVEVANQIGSVTSGAAVLSVHTAPGKPQANAATNITTGRFLASWNPVDSATSYRLDVSTRSSFSTYVSGYRDLDVGAVLSRYVNGLAPGTTYYYRVRAVNDLGASPSSNVIAVSTLPLQLAPAITSVNHTTFTLGLACTFTVTASGSPAPTFSATGLPSWLALDAATGVLSGTPPEGTVGASIPLVLTAANGIAPAASQAFTLKVATAPSASTPMTVTTIAGTAGMRGNTDGTGAFARFNHPSGITVDVAGNVDVADTDNFTIRQIDSSYAVTRIAGIAGQSGSAVGTATDATFAAPSAIVASDDSVVYIADTLNDTIISVSGGYAGRFAGQTGVAGSADGDASAAASFSGPQGLAWWRGVIPGSSSTRTFLYVADTANDTIRRIETILTTTTGPDGKPTTTPSYKVTTFAGLAGEAGAADGNGTAARFNGPTALAADRAGNVYVADTDNNTIRVISPVGAVRTLAGLAGSSGAADGTGSAARFNHPAALIADDSFNVYVLDSDNHTVRKITPAGKVTTVAGVAGQAGSADGTGADARFRNPTGITRSDDGKFYISDTNNHTVRLGLFPNAPAITSQPKNITLTAGASALFGVRATGVPEPTYQWLFNGKEISGATSATLSISGVKESDAGKYSVVVSNESGSVTSNEAVLTVTTPTSPGGITGGGGGGGAPGYGFLSALGLLAAARWLARRRAAQTLGSLN